MTKILTLETTCDETAAAVILGTNLTNSTSKPESPARGCLGVEVLSQVVASQEKLHQNYGGVVPEIASRAHVERILPVIHETLQKANLKLSDLDAIAVANTPGLSGSLLIGLMAAKTLCWMTGLPLIAINHLQAHIYACQISSGKNIFPSVGLIVSGGHSHLYQCHGPLDFTPLGGTIDDAAGEAFDKVASLLGLAYPGGPNIQRAAEKGDPRAIRFPRPLLNDSSHLNFSFSGLKTAVRYHITGPGKPSAHDPASGKMAAPLTEQEVADISASFQAAVSECLVGKAELALKKTGYQTLCVGGGVAANQYLREQLQSSAERLGYELHIPPLSLCTDNAVMGAIALERYQGGLFETLDLEIYPGLVRSRS